MVELDGQRIHRYTCHNILNTEHLPDEYKSFIIRLFIKVMLIIL